MLHFRFVMFFWEVVKEPLIVFFCQAFYYGSRFLSLFSFFYMLVNVYNVNN